MNLSTDTTDTITSFYIVCPLSAGSAVIAVFLSCILLTLVWRTKPHLHTLKHLLMCNTCLASIFFCIVQINNYIFLLFLPWDTSDVSCRWRAYFSYMSISAVVYSYLTQAISRFFFAVLSMKYPPLIKFKAHLVLILAQWLVVLLIPLPAIVTKDIYFRPSSLCWVPMAHKLHLAYTFFAYYFVPVLSIIVIYIRIYYQVKQAKTRSTNFTGSINGNKRDLEVLRNILILVGMYLIGGFPTLLYLVTSINLLYFAGLVSMSFVVCIEKVCTVLLDRDIRQIMKNLISPTRVTPVQQTIAIVAYSKSDRSAVALKH